MSAFNRECRRKHKGKYWETKVLHGTETVVLTCHMCRGSVEYDKEAREQGVDQIATEEGQRRAKEIMAVGNIGGHDHSHEAEEHANATGPTGSTGRT